MTGQRLGAFEIIGEIGRGGMGVVYRARDLSHNREVALKTLLPGLDLDKELVSRFKAEAQAASRRNHPNLVHVYDVGYEGQTHYFAMELVEGEDLTSIIEREGPLDYIKVAVIASQVAAGLGAVHGAGIVHRDVKPSNILVMPDLVVKISDFGVARLQEGADRLTATGRTVGTAHYMSPEQAMGERLDGRSDIYSLGVVLYEMLTGHVPFVGDKPLVVMKKHCEEEPPSIRRTRPDVPDRLAEVVVKCLAKDPGGRYQTAEALAADLDHVRLELEFAELNAETLTEGRTSLYSTRSVVAWQRELEARKGFWARSARPVAALLSSVAGYVAGTRDRDVVALRRVGGQMEEALEALAEAKKKRAQLRQKAANFRDQAERVRRESAEAFDAGDVTRVDELAEQENRCNEAAIDFEAVAVGLGDSIGSLEGRYKSARDEYERLRLKVELREARAIHESLDHRVADRRRRIRLVVDAALLSLCLAVLGYVLWAFDLRGSRDTINPASRPLSQREPSQFPPSPVQPTTGELSGPVPVSGHVRGWELLDAQLDIPSSGLTGEAVGGYLYAIGGNVRGTSWAETTHDVSRYSPSADAWSPLAPMPTARRALSSVVIGDHIYAIGGQTTDSTGRVERYDVVDDRWERVASLKTARHGAGVAAYGGKIYVFGGRQTGTDHSSVEVYDPELNRWNYITDMPSSGEPWRAATLGDRIYMSGGVFFSSPKHLWSYDPVGDVWDTSSLPEMNVSRCFHELVVAGGRLYAIGGSAIGEPYLSSVESWAPGESSWRSEPSLNNGRMQFGSAVVDDYIYVLGGLVDSDFTSTERLRIDSTVPDQPIESEPLHPEPPQAARPLAEPHP